MAGTDHSGLTATADIHVPKGFTDASNDTAPVKNDSGSLEWRALTSLGATGPQGTAGSGFVNSIATTDLTDPSTELNAAAGSTNGDMVVLYEVDAATDLYSLYVWDSADSGSESVPQKVDGSSGMWNLVRSTHPGVSFETGTITIKGTTSGDMSISVDADGDVMTLGADGDQLNIAGQAYSAQQATVTPTGTTQTINWNNGNSISMDLNSATGNVTLTLSNPVGGASYAIKVIQGGTARNLVWPAAVLWPGGTAPTISTTEDDIDLITLYYDGTNYLATFSQAFA